MFRKSSHSDAVTPRRLVRGAAIATLFAALLSACGQAAGIAEPLPTTDAVPTVEALPTTAAPTTGLEAETAVAPGGEGTTGAAATGNDLTVAQVVSEPENFYGQTISVVGEAQQVYGSSAFKLDEDSFLTAGIDNDLLVIGATESNPAVETNWLNNQVRVIGTLQQYVQTEVDRDFGWLDLTPEIEATFEGRPVLVADTVEQLETGALVPQGSRATGPIEGAPEGTLRVGDVTGDLATYVGQSVTVQGEVQDFYGATGVILDDDAPLVGGIDNDLLVVGVDPQGLGLDETGWLDSIIRVTGTVRAFNRTELEGELGYTLDDPLFDNWEGRPVLVADSIEQIR